MILCKKVKQVANSLKRISVVSGWIKNQKIRVGNETIPIEELKETIKLKSDEKGTEDKNIVVDESIIILEPPVGQQNPGGHSKGVIQFVGGFISGSYPMLFCGYFLSCLAVSGYTVVVYKIPPFQFNHFKVAIELIKKQKKVKEYFEKTKPSVVGTTPYFWVAYSTGCKILILLEVLSGSSKERKSLLSKYILDFSTDDDRDFLNTVMLNDYLLGDSFNYIRSQGSIFIAPEIFGTFSTPKGQITVQRGILNPLKKLRYFVLPVLVTVTTLLSVIIPLSILAVIAGILAGAYTQLVKYILPAISYFRPNLRLRIFPDSERTRRMTEESFGVLFDITAVIAISKDTKTQDDITFFAGLQDKKEERERERKCAIEEESTFSKLKSEKIRCFDIKRISPGPTDRKLGHALLCHSMGEGRLLQPIPKGLSYEEVKLQEIIDYANSFFNEVTKKEAELQWRG